MRYQEYIDLGFERYDLNCSAEKAATGYGGYQLTYALTKTAAIVVVYPKLNKHKLYLSADENLECRNVIVDITEDLMLDLIAKAKEAKS